MYRAGDDRWLAVSAGTGVVAERVMHLVGRPELIGEPWFASGRGRAAHNGLLDGIVSAWIAARDTSEVVAAFESVGAAVFPVYTVPDILADPQYEAIGTIAHRGRPRPGPLKMQNVPFRMSWTRRRGSGGPVAPSVPTTAAVYQGLLGLSDDDISRLAAAKVL